MADILVDHNLYYRRHSLWHNQFQISSAARRGALAVGLLLGAGVSVALGVFGRVHVPTYEGLPSFGFASTTTGSGKYARFFTKTLTIQPNSWELCI